MATTSDKEFLIRVKADIDQALRDLKKLPKEITETGKASKKSSKDVNSMGKSMQFLTRAAVAYFSIRTVSQLVRQADAFNALNVRIRTATKESGDFVDVQRDLFRITQQNGADFATTVSLFQGLARTAPELQATNSEILKLVDSVQKLGVISGASQAAQRAGLLQFSQGLAGGVFRAEEFNSILENLPEVASRLAKGMSLTVGQLRQLVLDGKLLSKDVFDSLLKQSQEISEEFEGIPDTVERSANRLSTSFANMLSQLDKASGTTSFIADLYNSLAQSFDNFSVRLGDSQVDKLNLELKVTEERLEALRKFASEDSSAVQFRLRNIKRIKKELEEIKALNEGSGDFVGPLQPSGDPINKAISQDQISAQKEIEKIEKSRVKSLEKLNTELKLQGDLYGKTAEDVALYKLQQLGASDAEIKAAQATFATIRAQKQMQEATEDGTRIFKETRTEMELLAAELTRLQELFDNGDIDFDTFSRASFNAEESFNKVKEEGKDTFAELTAATRGWGDQFTNTLADMVQQGKLDFSSLADSIISDLLRIAIQQSITGPLFGGLGVPGFESFVNHAGGFAGTGPKRTVNPFVFAGAKRYHSGGFPGLRSDEVPAILQKGELVLSKKQVASSGGGGSTRVEIINRGAPASVSESNVTTDLSGTVISIVIDDIDRGGKIRDRIDSVGGG